jgi:DNA-binding MarR family transcriptional regulator
MDQSESQVARTTSATLHAAAGSVRGDVAADTAGELVGELGGYIVEDQVGFLLRRAHQRHAALFQHGIGDPDLTPTQFTALVKMAEHGRVTQNQLGRYTAMDPATIQGVVRRLIARGLAHRVPDPLDRRTAVLSASPAGLALAACCIARACRITDATLSPLDAAERQQFLRLLRKMA